MNISAPASPTHTVMSAEITVVLDREYKVLLKKHINGEAKYEAEYIGPDGVSDQIKELVISTVIAHFNREPVW